MKKFLSSIVPFLTMFFMPLFEAAERKFTLGIVTRLDVPGTPAGGAATGGTTVNVNTTSNVAIDRSSEPIYSSMQLPTATPATSQQTVSSAAGSGAETITVYFLNEDVYLATPTTNGAAASNVTNTYSDGWAGNGYNNLAKSANAGVGFMVYGLTMVFKTISTGLQDPNALAGSEVDLFSWSLVGQKPRSNPAPLNAGVNAGNFKDGTMTVYKKFYMSSIDQISYQLPADTQSTLILLQTPQS